MILFLHFCWQSIQNLFFTWLKIGRNFLKLNAIHLSTICKKYITTMWIKKNLQRNRFLSIKNFPFFHVSVVDKFCSWICDKFLFLLIEAPYVENFLLEKRHNIKIYITFLTKKIYQGEKKIYIIVKMIHLLPAQVQNVYPFRLTFLSVFIHVFFEKESTVFGHNIFFINDHKRPPRIK